MLEHEAWRPSTWRVVEEREIAGAPTLIQVPARSRLVPNRTQGGTFFIMLVCRMGGDDRVVAD